MSQGSLILCLLLAALVAANLPFVNDRWFAIGPRHVRKHLGWQLLEWAVGLMLLVLLGRAMEGWLGQVAQQGWVFHVVVTCLFATLAFPGFVYRHLYRRGRY